MKEASGIVEHGQVKLPQGVVLPDGTPVKITWQESGGVESPIEREPLTDEDVAADLAWATGKRFRK